MLNHSVTYLNISGLDDFVERLQDVEVQEREEAVLEVEVTSEKATVTWHKVGCWSDGGDM